jgi:hypothetical protein
MAYGSPKINSSPSLFHDPRSHLKDNKGFKMRLSIVHNPHALPRPTAALGFFAFFTLFALLSVGLLLTPTALAQTSDPVNVRTAHANDKTRIVFHFQEMVGYKTSLDDSLLKITFAKPTPLNLSALTGTPFIRSFKTPKVTGNTQTLEIRVDDNLTLNHYRADRRIVFDLSKKTAAPTEDKKEKAQTPPPPKAETTKKDIAKTDAPKAAPPKSDSAKTKPNAPKENDAATAPPPVPPSPAQTPTADALPLPSSPAVLIDSIQTDPPQTISQTTPSPAPVPDTTITFSSLQKMAFASFVRPPYLWAVMDKNKGTTAPAIAGSLAQFISAPELVPHDDMLIYRFRIPDNLKMRASAQNLTWQIALNTQMNVPLSALEMAIEKNSQNQFIIRLTADGAKPLITITDPAIGDTIFVIPSDQTGEFIRSPLNTPNLTLPLSLQGIAIIPKTDDLEISQERNLTLISRQGGLALSDEQKNTAALNPEFGQDNANSQRLFDFENWRQGGVDRLLENTRRFDQNTLLAQDENDRANAYLQSAFLFFSNNFAKEALGYLDLALETDPKLKDNPSFLALRGATKALAGRFKDAERDLKHPLLANNPEVDLWRGYIAASTQRWREAASLLPADDALLLYYPDEISIPFQLFMTESALRVGNIARANELLALLDAYPRDQMAYRYQAALDYLKGEAARQDKRLQDAINLWRPIAGGRDQLYHTKATLALTMLLLQNKEIELKDAIDRLDSLRFSWRGDALEIQVLQALGNLKIMNQQYRAGLDDLTYAEKLSNQLLIDTTPIQDDIRRALYTLFVKGDAKNIKPLEAIAVFEQYDAFMPTGIDGEIALDNYINFLTEMDLLDKAADLLETRINSAAVSAERAEAGLRLASLYIIDQKPNDALTTLDKIAADPLPPALMPERIIMRAKALSQKGEKENAVALLTPLLDQSASARTLLADIEWRARNWPAAARATERLIPNTLTTPKITDAEAQAILNTAVAYRLAGDQAKRAELKNRYGAVMAQSNFADLFDVVTREAGSTSLADRETILRIARNADLFSDVLKNYRKNAAPQKTDNNDASPAEKTP